MIYVICGPTGVGKTKLSVMLAKKKNGIVINADSMQVYKELNIGTAKTTTSEMEKVPHYLFDIKSIYSDFNAFMYQEMGRTLLSKYKNKDIVIVGGTGLYIKALLYDYTFDGKSSNRKLYDFKMIGLTMDRNSLYEKINNRVDIMIKSGLIDEASNLYKKGKFPRALMAAIGYKELFLYFDGKISLEEAISLIKKNSRHYAKRQYTFFKNQFDNIVWYDVLNNSLNDITNDICCK